MNAHALLGRHVQTFFDEYLTAQRNVSPNTVLAYRDTLKLFFAFAATKLQKPVVELSMSDLSVDVVLSFLTHLEGERKNSISTRNARLATLRVFYGHVAARAPDELEVCQRVQRIPAKRAPKPEVNYLEPDEMNALLSGIGRASVEGRRDYALVAFAYQTGARVQEIVSLKARDLQLEPPAQVRIWGKGRKERILPLWPKTALLLRRLLQERNVDPRAAAPVFVNIRGQSLTRWGVRHILRKYTAVAARTCPTLADKSVHPHVLRHTTAMHMLQSGSDPSAIRDVLGHASAETTWKYARINLDTKRKAIEACALAGPKIRCAPVPVWRKDKDLLAQLEALSRRPNYGE